MLRASKFAIDDNKLETLGIESSPLQYICFFREYGPLPGPSISWHWHPAIEIDYIAEGDCEFRTPSRVMTLHKGEAIFINSNVLHDVTPDDSGICHLYTHLFDMHFLSGMYRSVFELDYMATILHDRSLDAYLIRPDHYSGVRMMESILKAIELADTEPKGYEFEIRSELSRFWLLFSEETKDIRREASAASQRDSERIKLMMEYVQGHFGDKISLEDIAGSASVSARECTRCFQRCTGASPFSYVNEYRVRAAAQALLDTDLPVLSIAEECGFSSSSYFGQVFHEIMGCTPGQYRKNRR